MTICRTLSAVTFILLTGNTVAQDLDQSSRFDLDTLQDEGVIVTFDNGFIPTNLDSMVKLSDLVVKGRYGKLLSHGPFYGYGSSKEAVMEQYELTDEADLKFYSLPMSEYEIVVDEVLHGTLPKGPVIYRIYESDPTDRRVTSPLSSGYFSLDCNLMIRPTVL
ncbi:MAG: hypothetical protein JKY86_01970 [Gammaproteobacteria bacterium]|nr:hypothetical protein [Gammaproteobacteria bacterium]MBL4890257.1 hypothetical protein [Rhizobiaceae bacterium]